MKSSNTDTVIIGGGISGLACAHHLQQNNQDFILISKDIGGRIRISDDGEINYGAFFVCKDYYNILPYVTLKSRIYLRDFCFHNLDESYTLYSPELIGHVGDFIKIHWILRHFRRHLHTFRKKAETTSQKTIMENNPWLYRLYMMDACDFIHEQAIEHGTEKYLSYGLYSTTFSPVSEMNAFSFLEFLLPLITPIYRFTFEKERLINPFTEKILLGTVRDIKYQNKRYTIQSDTGTVSAKNLVLATEIGWSAKYAGVQVMNKPVSTNMLHVSGIPKKCISKKQYQMFTYPSNIQAIANLQDGSYLVYYKDEQPALEGLFSSSHIIAHHFWNPVGRIDGHILTESKRGNNMYLIGDYNIVGLEEAFITGLFAANQIIHS